MPKTWFYAIRGGATPGVYSSWAEAVAHGAQGASIEAQKKFATHWEAEAFVAGSNAAAKDKPKSGPWNHTQRASGTQHASRSSGSGGGITPDELACFTDGACKGNCHVHMRSCPAGWGVVVVEGLDGDGTLGGRSAVELFGPVSLERSSPYHLGAEVS